MPPKMFERQKSGSVLCSSCGKLVGVNDETCFNCGRSNPSMWGFGGAIRALGRDMGFVRLVIIGSVFLYIATLAVDPSGIRMGGFMSMLSPSQPALFILGASGQYPVFELGRWWTVLSAGWLHGGLIHIGFNMYWVQSLAPAVAEYYGAGRMIIIYTVACITGFVFSSVAMLIYPYIPFGWLLSYVGLAGAQLTIGASASVFGLLGALWYYGRRTGSTALAQQMKFYAIMFRGLRDRDARCGQPSPSRWVRWRLFCGEVSRPADAGARRPLASRSRVHRAHRHRRDRLICDGAGFLSGPIATPTAWRRDARRCPSSPNP